MGHVCRRVVAFGIGLGSVMLCFSLLSSPSPEWERFFLIFAGSMGGLLAYFYQKSSPIRLSLRKITVVASAVGFAGGILYFVCSAVIFLVIANKNIVLNKHSIALAVIGLVQLTVTAGLGGLIVGLLSTARLRVLSENTRKNSKHLIKTDTTELTPKSR